MLLYKNPKILSGCAFGALISGYIISNLQPLDGARNLPAAMGVVRSPDCPPQTFFPKHSLLKGVSGSLTRVVKIPSQILASASAKIMNSALFFRHR